MNLVEMVTGGRPDETALAWSEDGTKKYLHGLVTSCKHANQCEGHAVYCMHDDGPRKCGRLWNDGKHDGECSIFELNEHFKGSLIDTFNCLSEKGLAFIEEIGG